MNHPVLRSFLAAALAGAMLLGQVSAAAQVPDQTLPTEPQETQAQAETLAQQSIPTEAPAGPGIYFGLLHAHSGLSSGVGTPEEAFAHAAGVEGLDFFALTELSHSLDGQEQSRIDGDGAAVSQSWARGKAAAAAATTDRFVAIFGYEMAWPRAMGIGHISTFATPGFQSWMQEGYNSHPGPLTRYYQALAGVPGAVGQFNHPTFRLGNFSGFDYCQEADQVMALLELDARGEDGWDDYIQALDKGWHVAPTSNQISTDCQWDGSRPGRTAVHARSLTEEAIYEALRQRRVYATDDPDLEIHYALDGHPMGSRLKRPQVGESADLTVTLRDPTDQALGLVEVITGGGQAAASQTLDTAEGSLSFSLPPEPGYYLLRITQPDGDRAVTAPVWIESGGGVEISGLTCQTREPVQGEPVTLTVEISNREWSAFLVEALDILVDGVPTPDCGPACIEGDSVLRLPVTLLFDSVGTATVTVRLRGTLDGIPHSSERTIELQVSPSLPEPEDEIPQPLSIGQARQTEDDTLVRVQGYVTAGTDKPQNRFPDTIYIQDDTGGIAVTPFSGEDLPVGTAVEVTGHVQTLNGNRILRCSAWTLPNIRPHSWAPLTGSWNTLLDPRKNGGALVEVLGTCREIYCREDGLLTGFLLEDSRGRRALVRVEEGIGNSGSGKNRLQESVCKGRTIRAAGLLHVDEYGQTLIRVRNCEEVHHVPPMASPSYNPPTGHRIPGLVPMACSAAGVLLMLRRRAQRFFTWILH